MKPGDKITGSEARALIEKHGVDHAIIGGAHAEISASDIEDTDTFGVVVNYGHGVQLHLDSDIERAIIVLRDLVGRVEGSEWAATPDEA